MTDKTDDDRDWITEAIQREGGARRIFRAKFLEPHQLEGINELENYAERRAVNRRDEDDNRSYWQRYKGRR